MKDRVNAISRKAVSVILSVIITLSMAAGIVTISQLGADNNAYAGVVLQWPVPGHTQLSQGLHNKNAIDINDGNIAGATVVAAYGGTVKQVFRCTQQHYGSFGDCNGFGTGLVIIGDDGRTYQYAHMQANSIPSNVYVGAYVATGQTIGRVGTTGNSSGNHLHFGICYGNYWEGSGNPLAETYRYSNVQNSSKQSNTAAKNTSSKFTIKATTKSSPKFNDAYVYTKFATSNGQKVKWIGANVTIYDAKGKKLVKYSEKCSWNSTYLEAYYNIKAETGLKLKSKTKYSYQIGCILDDGRVCRKVTGPKRSFTTK